MTVLDPRVGQHRSSRKSLLANMRGYRALPKQDRVSKASRAWSWLLDHGHSVKTYLFALVAFASPTVAAFTWHLWAGLVVLGIAAFLFDAATNPAPPVDDMSEGDLDELAE